MYDRIRTGRSIGFSRCLSHCLCCSCFYRGMNLTPFTNPVSFTGQAAAFWKCLESSETDDDEDDSGALAAVGCLRAIGTILESVSRLPEIYPAIEPTLLPIMQRMLTTDGQGELLYSSEVVFCKQAVT